MTKEEAIFDEARRLFPNKAKKGNKREYANFVYRSTHPVPGSIKFSIKKVLPLLKPAIQDQIDWRRKANGKFRPPWKNFQTWINGGCWEYEVEIPKSQPKAHFCFYDKKPATEAITRSGQTKYICDECVKMVLFTPPPLGRHGLMKLNQLSFSQLEQLIEKGKAMLSQRKAGVR